MAEDIRPRASWDEYFMSIAQVVATRSTCPRKYVGAVLVRNRTILSTGYNGSIRGMPHCSDVGHMMEEGHCVATIHAEANAIIQAARNGVIAAKLASKCEVQFAYAIGHPDPVSVHIDTFGTATVSELKITRAVNRVFDFQPSAIIDQLKLRRPIYSKTTNYGHFGKNDKDLTWEATNKVAALRSAL